MNSPALEINIIIAIKITGFGFGAYLIWCFIGWLSR